jgi:hypothetical protein
VDDRYYLSIGGRSLVYDILTQGWALMPYGFVSGASVLSLDLSQAPASVINPNAQYPLLGQARHASPEVVLMTPCSATMALGALLFGMCGSISVGTWGETAISAQHTSFTPGIPGEIRVASPGVIRFQPFDGKGLAVNSRKRAERFTLWGATGATGPAGTLRMVSDMGGDETYSWSGEGDGMGHLVQQGFGVGMVGELLDATLYVTDTEGVSIREARLEYSRLN